MTASLPAYTLIPLPGEGPEDVVVGPDGLIYTGLLDGRVLAVAPEDGAVREVANTGGRPLGLEATADGRLLICDSPKGLLELDLKTGALKTLVTHDRAERLIFCSNVVAAPDGNLFFTVSTMRYDIHDWKKDIVENWLPRYTGTSLAEFGAYILLTNFDNYVEWLGIVYAITLACCPALSLPCGFTASGLPVGLQMVAAPRGEAPLLAGAKVLEDILGVRGTTPIDPKAAPQ